MLDNELTYKGSDDGLLVIMPDVLAKMLSYRQLRLFSKEAAGVLIGERRGPHLVVRQISEPGPGDLRCRFFVDRRGQHHQAMVNEAFVRSSGYWQYLGEWHTHPEDVPAPSSKDLLTWNTCIEADKPMALVIVGRTGIWAGKKLSQVITSLQKVGC